MKRKLTTPAILFVLLLTAFAPIASAEVTIHDFFGAWLNNDTATGGITRILLTPGTLRNNLDIHAYGKCHPYDCDWDTITIVYPGNPFVAVYDFGFSKHTLTFTYNEQTKILHVHDYNERGTGGVSEYDYYFSKMTQPDLIIREIDIPTSVITYQAEPWTWYTFKVHNLGAPWTAGAGQELFAKIVNATRNGEPYIGTGYMDLSATTSLDIGQYAEHAFAITWTPGEYKFQIMADHDDLIPEAIDSNNLSRWINLTVLQQHDLAGICRFNYLPIHYYTDQEPEFYFSDSSGSVAGIDTYYYPESSRYAAANLPLQNDLGVAAVIHTTGSESTLPGNYRSAYHPFDLTTMTDYEKENFDINFHEIMHMTSPWDNNNIESATSDPYPEHQPGIIFEWEPVTGAVEYELTIKTYRDSSHPSGYGYVSEQVDFTTTDTSYLAVLPNSETDEHYQTTINARNGSGKMIGLYLTTYTDGSGPTYRFKVNSNCYEEIPKPHLHVVKKVVEDYAGTLKNRYTLNVSNYMDLPAELFTHAPDLAPCGINTNSSRTWITIYDIDGNRLGSFCGIYSPQSLNILNFAIPVADPQPLAVYLELEDRRCGIIYTSTIADTTYPCPLADLNDDCKVNLLDLAIMGAQWLQEELL